MYPENVGLGDAEALFGREAPEAPEARTAPTHRPRPGREEVEARRRNGGARRAAPSNIDITFGPQAEQEFENFGKPQIPQGVIRDVDT